MAKSSNLFLYVILISILTSTWACAPTRYVKPLQKGEKNIGATFGGELIEYGSGTIPLPLSSIVGGYGVDSNLTVFFGLHTTAMYFNNFQFDAGITKNILTSKTVNVSCTPVVNFITNIYNKETRFWPQLDLNVYGFYGNNDKNYAYLGFSNWFELSKTAPNNQPFSTRWIFSPQMGTVLGLKNKWNLTFEIKQLAPFYNNEYSFVPWKSVTGKTGATAVFVGVSKSF